MLNTLLIFRKKKVQNYVLNKIVYNVQKLIKQRLLFCIVSSLPGRHVFYYELARCGARGTGRSARPCNILKHKEMDIPPPPLVVDRANASSTGGVSTTSPGFYAKRENMMKMV
jgi:hypothetical protein